MARNLIRKRTAEILEAAQDHDKISHLVDLILISLILLSVLLAILDTIPGFNLRYRTLLVATEIGLVSIFTMEYLLRLWSSVELRPGGYRHPVTSRLRWAVTPLGIVDLLAILPFYLYFIIPDAEQSLLLLRIFRGIRLLRLFKLTRYSPAIHVMRSVAKQESRTLMAAGFMLLIILIIASWGIYVLENDTQKEVFSSIPAAMWWAIVSLTTVGYGDVVPVTTGGKIFAGIISLVGIGMMALPAGILASGFSNEVNRRNQAYKRAVDMALADGSISEQEQEYLEQLRDNLGISEEQAKNQLIDAQRMHRKGKHCPHCGEPLN